MPGEVSAPRSCSPEIRPGSLRLGSRALVDTRAKHERRRHIVATRIVTALFHKPHVSLVLAAQARVRLLCRIVDLYVFPPVVSLLRLPKDGDAESIETAKADTVAGLNHLEHFLANTGFACGTSLTLADITLHGGVGLAVMVMGNHGITDRFEGQPKLAKWWATINANPTLKPALDEIHETVRKFRQQREAEAATKKSAAG